MTFTLVVFNEMSKQLLKGLKIYNTQAPLRINSNHFGVSLDFHVAPSIGQAFVQTKYQQYY